MKNVSIPIGFSNFTRIRENGDYYIDKSGLIKELLKSSAKVTWITRLCRFGKTLNMNMLASFFDIRKNSSALFNGLEITENQSLCNDWMNQYPTLFLTFKDVDGLTFESAKDMLRAQIAQICNEHDYLLNSKAVSENDKQTFRQLAVITGCLMISKESIFTGTNNFISDTITDSRLNEYFGFTQTEVERFLQIQGIRKSRS